MQPLLQLLGPPTGRDRGTGRDKGRGSQLFCLQKVSWEHQPRGASSCVQTHRRGVRPACLSTCGNKEVITGKAGARAPSPTDVCPSCPKRLFVLSTKQNLSSVHTGSSPEVQDFPLQPPFTVPNPASPPPQHFCLINTPLTPTHPPIPVTLQTISGASADLRCTKGFVRAGDVNTERKLPGSDADSQWNGLGMQQAAWGGREMQKFIIP